MEITYRVKKKSYVLYITQSTIICLFLQKKKNNYMLVQYIPYNLLLHRFLFLHYPMIPIIGHWHFLFSARVTKPPKIVFFLSTMRANPRFTPAGVTSSRVTSLKALEVLDHRASSPTMDISSFAVAWVNVRHPSFVLHQKNIFY